MKRRDLLLMAAAATAGMLLPLPVAAAGQRPPPVKPGPWDYPEIAGQRLVMQEPQAARAGRHDWEVLEEGALPPVGAWDEETGAWTQQPEGYRGDLSWDEWYARWQAEYAAHRQASAAARADPDFDRQTREYIEQLRRLFRFHRLPPAPDDAAALDQDNLWDYLKAAGKLPADWEPPLERAPVWVPLAGGGRTRLT